jgi:hypothetical protein
MFLLSSIGLLPPLLVQRCNGSTAGLGYLEVNVICDVHANLPIGRLLSVRTVDSHWGEWHNSSADFNPNHHYVNAAPNKQASRLPHVHTTMQPSSTITVYKMFF